MPRPTAGDLHIDRALTNVSVAYAQDPNGFVADQVFRNIPVQMQSDKYYKYGSSDLFRSEMKKRASGTESEGIGFDVSTDNYLCDVYSLHMDIGDQERANQDEPINLDRDATNLLTHQSLLNKEKKFVEKFFTNGKWATNVTGVNGTPTSGQFLRWNDAASTPIEDWRDAKAEVLESTGIEPRVGVLGYRTYVELIDHPDIVDRIKYSGGVGSNRPAIIGLEALAQLLDLDKLYVMKAVENTAKQGLTQVNGFIGGKHALLLHVAPTAGLLTPTAGYTFSWNGLLGAGALGNRIKRYRMEHLAADRIEIDLAYDMKMVCSDLGYFFNTAVA